MQRPPLSAKRAVRIGSFVTNAPLVLIIATWVYFPKYIAGIPILLRIFLSLLLATVMGGIARAVWRAWALRRGVDPAKLVRLEVASGMVTVTDDDPPPPKGPPDDGAT